MEAERIPTFQVAYLCDRKKCEVCHEECRHTLDIRHAKNFRKVTEDRYIEIEEDVRRYE